jgi:hypothetical protein
MAFIQFFRNCFLDNEAINMILHCLQLWVQRNPTLLNKVMIPDLYFTHQLLDYHSDVLDNKPNGRDNLLKSYQLLLRLGLCDVLYLVANPSDDHWVVIQVDYLARTIAYGDSGTII